MHPSAPEYWAAFNCKQAFHLVDHSTVPFFLTLAQMKILHLHMGRGQCDCTKYWNTCGGLI